MKNTIRILAIAVFGLVASCKDKSDDVQESVSTGFPFEIFSSSGDDLLNPSTNGAITEENTDLYYLVNGNLEKQFDSNMQFAKHFSIGRSDFTNTYVINPYLNTSTDPSGISITVLKYSNHPADTIKAQITKNGSIHWGNVWINSKQVIDVNWDEAKLRQPVRHMK